MPLALNCYRTKIEPLLDQLDETIFGELFFAFRSRIRPIYFYFINRAEFSKNCRNISVAELSVVILPSAFHNQPNK